MRVIVDEREYTLYINERGEWTMHTWNLFAPEGERWIDTVRNVSDEDPFVSTVVYDAWR